MAMEINNQQLAVAQNLGAVNNLDVLFKSELDKFVDTKNVDNKKTDESALKKALNGKKGDAGTEIIAGLATKLAQTLAPEKLLGKLQDEFGFVLDAKDESKEDKAEIRLASQHVTKTSKQKQNMGSDSGSQQDSGGDQQQRQPDEIKQYIGAYSQLLVNGGQEAKKKIEKMESRLVNEKGVSIKDLQSVKVQAANTVRTEILHQVKTAFLKNIMAKGKSLESIMAKKELNNFIDFAFLNENIGGYDFGGMDENLQGAVDGVKDKATQELSEHVRDEMKHLTMKKAMGNESKELEKEIEDLLKLGKTVGFDLGNLVEQIPKMKDDLGLNPVIEFYEEASGAYSDSGQDRPRHQYQYTEEEEKELYTDKLRAIYLRRAVYGDPRTVFETQLKMMKLKNGLIRLGAVNVEEIEAQGKALAKVKLMAMLGEAFEERATYAKLAGEAWKMTEKKLKTIIKNLEKLGINLSQTELDAMRDKANERMYNEAEHELKLIDVAIEAQGEVAYLTQKRKMAIEILGRISGESGLDSPGRELNLSEAC